MKLSIHFNFNNIVNIIEISNNSFFNIKCILKFIDNLLLINWVNYLKIKITESNLIEILYTDITHIVNSTQKNMNPNLSYANSPSIANNLNY